jgi:leucyl-tRNA synthetase
MDNPLIPLGKKWQDRWSEAKLFESEVDETKPKFFITVPYPYLSGSLHVGHGRVVTEADIYARYMRMKGYNVLFPLSFHISGMPVLGISMAIAAGDAKSIKLYSAYVRAYESDEKKIAEIVQSFTDPWNIVHFFLPKMKSEFSTLGPSIDWRRSFSSGDGAHQALVEWQFKKYEENNYLVKGDHPVLFSLSLQNPVGEDDIKDGDSDPVEKQEFTILKFKFDDGYICAATLRPETMYGQTNMWVHPEIEYVRAEVNDEIWYISKECAEKLSYQKHKVKIIDTILGSEFIGKTCIAPLINKDIPIFPSTFCKPGMGTGMVTSVPGHAPYDYMAILDLRKDPALCTQWGILTQVETLEIVPILHTPEYGENASPKVCKEFGITSASDDKIKDALKKVYKVEHHTGKLLQNCGKFSGMTVPEAKLAMRDELIKNKEGLIMYETTRQAFSRDGGSIIVAVLNDQWFLDFNSTGWKKKSHDCLQQMKLLPESYRKRFEETFAWLDKRPCARRRGLGTRLPQDQDWVIESLSDSTMYMTLYPIFHKIQQYGITKKQLTPAFFDYVYNGHGSLVTLTTETGISEDQLKDLQRSFSYWYPLDHRHTFELHLSNHLSFMIFAHAALLDNKNWPKTFSFHGLITSEGAKMSKSKGNVVTLLDVAKQYGADTYRGYLVTGANVDSIMDWQSEKVGQIKNHIMNLYCTLQKITEERSSEPVSKEHAWFISTFERSKKKATLAVEQLDLRTYAMTVIYELHAAYKKVVRSATPVDLEKIHDAICDDWIKMLAPIVPHLSEELWSKKHERFVSVAPWPKANESKIDPVAEFSEELKEGLAEDIRKVMTLAKIEKPSNIQIIISPQWKYTFVGLMKSLLAGTRDPGQIMKAVMETDLKKYGQQVTKLIPSLIKDPKKMPGLIIDQGTEGKAVTEASRAIAKEHNCPVEIIVAEHSNHAKAKVAFPGKPAIIVE